MSFKRTKSFQRKKRAINILQVGLIAGAICGKGIHEHNKDVREFVTKANQYIHKKAMTKTIKPNIDYGSYSGMNKRRRDSAIRDYKKRSSRNKV